MLTKLLMQRKEPDLILWTMMLTGYAKYELLSKAFELYEQDAM